jgi:hypothetical protein
MDECVTLCHIIGTVTIILLDEVAYYVFWNGFAHATKAVKLAHFT